MNEPYESSRRCRLTEKATLLGETHQQVRLPCQPARQQNPDQAGDREAVQEDRVAVNTCNYAGKKKRERPPLTAAKPHWKKAIVPSKRATRSNSPNLSYYSAMALKTFRPLTPTNRFKALPAFDEITKSKPEKSLRRDQEEDRRPQQPRPADHPAHRRRSQAEVPHHRFQAQEARRGRRGHRDRIRSESHRPHRAASNTRTARRLTSSPRSAWQSAPRLVAGENAAPEVGNALPLKSIPLGTAIHNVEIVPGRGGQIARSAGQQVDAEQPRRRIRAGRMPSGEIRRIHEECYATIGQVGNVDHMNVSAGKAGRSRWHGRPPDRSRHGR